MAALLAAGRSWRMAALRAAMRSGREAALLEAGGERTAGGLLGGLDPRIRLAVLVLWSVELALAPGLRPALLGLAGSLVFAAAGGALGDPRFWRRLLAVNGFLVLVWLLLPFSFSVPGDAAFSIWGLEATRQGVELSSLISVKALGVTAGALALTRAVSVQELLAAARALGAPEKAAALAFLTARYVSVVGREYRRLRNAMKARGFRARASLHSLRSLGALAGMLLLRGVERAERVRAAMLCRGWAGRFWIRASFRAGPGDLAFALLVLALSAVAAGAS
jgi:cobalt/nickel transport system permease protein